MQEFTRSLPMMLYRAIDAVMPRFREIFKDYGLTEQQWRVLRVLWQCDEVPFRELSELTLIPPPSLVGVIDRLGRAGLVARRRSEADRRLVYVLATAEGRALEAEVVPRVERAYAALRGSLDESTWNSLLDGLDQVSSTNDKQPSRAANTQQGKQ